MTTTTLEHVLDVAASPSTVYELWTTVEGLESWFADEATITPSPGGELRLVVDGDHVMLGEFVELDPPHRVRFTFGWEHGELAPGSTEVDIHIEATGTGSRLTLRHTGLPIELLETHAQGWTHFVGGRLADLAGPAR